MDANIAHILPTGDSLAECKRTSTMDACENPNKMKRSRNFFVLFILPIVTIMLTVALSTFRTKGIFPSVSKATKKRACKIPKVC
jgi:hypothetical protein